VSGIYLGTICWLNENFTHDWFDLALNSLGSGKCLRLTGKDEVENVFINLDLQMNIYFMLNANK
jgi:hypothetical protein